MHPKIYSVKDHQISPRKIDRHAFYVIHKLREQGFLAYLVGGSVRDLLLNKRPKDFDISTSAKPEEIKEIFKKKCLLIGKRFRLAHIRFGNKILEVSTFRAGDPEENSLIQEDNVWGSAEEDALRRDFTINGLFYDPETENIIDYVNGFEDAKKHLLRAIGNPRLRFVQDPVRMIRLLKFKARFDFDFNKETIEALYECKKEINKSSSARILEELFRMLESGSSENFFQLLEIYGFLEIFFPFLSNHIKTDKKTWAYLKEIDIISLKNHSKFLDRSILASALIFDALCAYLKETLSKPTHLGEISEKIHNYSHEFFKGFFKLPRKIKVAMRFILIHQFRFTPLTPVKRKRPKISNDPFFSFALNFLEIRCMLNHDLYKTYALWKEAFVKQHQRKRTSRSLSANR